MTTDADALREDYRRYAAAVRPGTAPIAKAELAKLRKRAAAALDALGGEPEPARRSLRDYDHLRFGPYLGVSGEPGAAPAIRDAALASPKVVALGLTDPLEVGVAHDAERLGSIGELPSGPDEYREIRLETVGRILTSTNVGSRLNVRYYGTIRELWVNPAPLRRMKATAVESLLKRLAPFVNTPDGRPRRTSVDVCFRAGVTDREAVLRALVAAIEHPGVHSLRLVTGDRKLEGALEAIELAGQAGVSEVAVRGRVRTTADAMLSAPGVLNYFNPREAARLFEAANAVGVRVTPANRVDCESVARLAWTSLAAARRMGLELGKYALFPLTLDESAEVVECVQRWFHDWTAAPAFYVDIDTIAIGRVFPRREVSEAARAWLDTVGAHGVKVVLIDTVMKGEGRHLLKTGPRDSKGIFTLDQIRDLDAYARGRGVRALWAGGITVPQAYELARLEVFGLYVTSAVASTRAVGPDHEADPGLAAERFPTEEGVAKVKLAIEAGFAETQLRKRGKESAANGIRAAAQKVFAESGSAADENELRKLVTDVWTHQLS